MSIMRNRWIALLAIYTLLAGDLFGNTSVTTISRLKLDHPDLGYDGGAGLHTAIANLYTRIGDNMNSRYQEYTSVANSTTTTYEHNFGVALSELVVRLYTGTGNSKVRIANPTASGWTIAATGGFTTTKIDITTPSVGGPWTFSVLVVHGRGSTEKLDDLDDVDVTTTAPQDGQALVYDLNSTQWLPGASGDSSLKCQTISTPNLTLKQGYLILSDGSEIQVASDLTVNLTTILGTTPANATAYYLYLDRNALPSATTLTNGRKVIVASSASHFSLQTSTPDTVYLTRYIPLCVIKSATTGNAWSGTGSAFATLATRRHDRPVVNVNPTVYSLSQQNVGSIGSSGQVAAGHVLTSASFPTFTTNLSFYNLTSTSDGSGNTRTLTNNGTVPFTGTNILGTTSAAATFNGTSQSLSSTSSFFNPGNGVSFATGGWFKATDWTPTAQQFLIAQQNTSSDQGFGIYVDTNGDLHYYGTNTAASKDLDIKYTNPGLTDGTWHHLAMVYNFSTTTLKGYLDGQLVVSGFLANQRTVTTPIFQIGAQNTTASNWFAGSAEDIYFTTLTLKDEDIRRTYAYRADHNQNVAVANQDWNAVFAGNLTAQLGNDWLVHQTANSVFWDFSELASTDQVAVTMANKSFTTTVVPINTFDTGKLTSAPSFPLSHGLGVIPKDFYVLTTGQSLSGQDDKRYDLCSATSTTITCDLSSLTIDSSHQVEIVASAAPIAIAVPAADATTSGILTASAQNIGGAKTFAASPTFSLGLTSSGTSTFNSGLTSNGTTNFNSGFTASAGTITGLATLTGGYSAGAASSVTGTMTVTGRGLFNYPTETSGQIYTTQQATFASGGTFAFTIPGWGFVIAQNCNSGEIAVFLVSSAGTFLVSTSGGWAAGTGAGTNNKLSFNSGTGVITATNNNAGARTYAFFVIALAP
jgi:hypothetical protein